MSERYVSVGAFAQRLDALHALQHCMHCMHCVHCVQGFANP